jgi:hypothetical protein
LLILIAFSPISVSAQERYAKFPAVRVELPQPEGYTVAEEKSRPDPSRRAESKTTVRRRNPPSTLVRSGRMRINSI